MEIPLIVRPMPGGGTGKIYEIFIYNNNRRCLIMDVMCIFFGAAIVGMAWAMIEWKKNKKPVLTRGAITGIVVDVILLFFTIGWCVSSIIEGENQAAGMGLLFFGGFTLVVFALTRRLVKKSN